MFAYLFKIFAVNVPVELDYNYKTKLSKRLRKQWAFVVCGRKTFSITHEDNFNTPAKLLVSILSRAVVHVATLLQDHHF